MKSIHHRNVINTHVISNKSNLIKQKHSTLSVSQIKQTKRKYTESLINTINEDLTDKYQTTLIIKNITCSQIYMEYL